MKRLFLFTALMLLAWPAASKEPDSDASAARGVVEEFHEVLLGCMQQADELGFRGRYDRILVSLEEAFDLSFMTRAALGATWRQLSEEELADFVVLTQRFSATRYSDNFDGYDEQRFETRSQQPAARGTLVVMTELVQPNDRNVEFDYRLRKVDGRWRIIDVQLDGMVSELAMRRGQYRSLIEREGFPRLVEVIESKIEELSVE